MSDLTRYHLYSKDDLGGEGPALYRRDEYGDWYNVAEVDAAREADRKRIAELQDALQCTPCSCGEYGWVDKDCKRCKALRTRWPFPSPPAKGE